MTQENIIGKRLRAARERAGYSQKQLGIDAGFDPFSASPRVNHYERGRHQPDFKTLRSIARLLKVPTAYFYAEDDDLAALILNYSALPKKAKADVSNRVKALIK